MTCADIPDKLYFRIGEVSELIDVKPYVLRYWETEFLDIKPVKSKSGQRLYKKRDVEILFRIKSLLYEQGFTINGARQKLKDLVRDLRDETAGDVSEQMEMYGGAVSGETKNEPAREKTDKEQRKILVKLKEDLQRCVEEMRK